jgi:GNAT superfamily N-acetyltransferase
MNPPVPLEQNHNRREFDCGEEALNDYIRRYARQSQDNDAARVFVVLDDNKVVGFYTISSLAVSSGEVPRDLAKGMPSQIPAVLIGRFAVDKAYQSIGIGRALLRDAFHRIANVSEDIGIKAVIVDAKTPEVRRWYIEQVGFHPFEEGSSRLYLTLKEIRKTLGLI